MLPFDLFLAALVLLMLVDVWSTAKGIKAGQGEANGLLRRLAKAIGIREALLLLKGAYLYLVWQTPPTSSFEQWLTLGLYAAVAVNNLRVLRKAKSSR